MKNEKYRITARIKRADGVQKTVSYRGNIETLEKDLKRYFKAKYYKPVRFGQEGKFSSGTEWREIEC